MTIPVIVSAVRTPIAKKGGALNDLHPSKYGGLVIQEAIRRATIDKDEIDDVIFGNCLSGGGNIARLSLLEAGLSVDIPGLTIDRQCGSGINSIVLGAQAISSGDGIVVAGGTESMTTAPYLLGRSPRAYDQAPPRFINRQLSPNEIGNPLMGITAENLAEKYEISREEQDRFALSSQEKMKHAMETGRFKEQILPIEIKKAKGNVHVFDTDEHPRETSFEALLKLPPAFKVNGTVTAGNSSGINDGASAVVMMSLEEARKRGLEPLGKVVGWAVAGVDPNIMGIGPVPATKKVLAKTGLSLNDLDLIEINEAFAAQVIACHRELKFDMDKVNVNGGAIAHGHPIAATGTALVTKLLYELKDRNLKRGLVTACIGGGQGIALILER
jgi:acetyl-CoA C-acetyltransferase